MARNAKLHALLTGVIALHLAILLAGFIAPYSPATQNREQAYAPPTCIHFVDASGFHFRPFVYASTTGLEGNREDKSREFRLHLLAKGDTYKALGIFRTNSHLFGVDAPGQIFLLGTDSFGRDEVSRLLYGGQVSAAP